MTGTYRARGGAMASIAEQYWKRRTDLHERVHAESGCSDGALEPTFDSMHVHEPGDPIGALIDVVDPRAKDYVEAHPDHDRYVALPALSAYSLDISPRQQGERT